MDPFNSSNLRYPAARESGPENPLTVFTSSIASRSSSRFSNSLVSRSSTSTASIAQDAGGLSRSFITESVRDGALSSRRAQSTSALTDARLGAMVSSVGERMTRINQAIAEFSEQCKELNNTILMQFRKLSTGDIFEGTDDKFDSAISRYGVLLSASTQTLALIKQAQETFLAINKSGLEIDTQSTMDVVDLIFRVRKEEISLLGKQFDLIERVENHHFNQFMQAYKLELEEQAQMFKQMKELAEFQSNEKQLEADRDLKVKAQAHQEVVDLKRLSLDERVAMRRLAQEEKKQEQDHEIERVKLKLDESKFRLEQAFKTTQEKVRADIERKHHELEAETERERIAADERARSAESDAEARVGVAQAAASASRCSIM